MATLFSSYDEPLGPRSDRYFGEGYKKVCPDLNSIRIARSTRPGAKHTGMASLSYPAAWSRKEHSELVPHVSSVDTIVLATSLCDAAISHARDLRPAEAARIWVRHASVRSGTNPHVDLDNIPVTATITGTTESEDEECETTFAFRVGNLTGTLTMAHPAGTGALDLPGFDNVGALRDVHGRGPHYFLDGVKDHTLTATDIVIDDDATRITGRHEISVGVEGGYVGAESAYWNSVSPIDVIVGAAQLSQILLYQMDSLDRASSNTLWMRKLEFCTDSPRRPTSEVFDGTVEVRRAPVIDRGGKRWRSADLLIKEFQGLTGSCLLAHQLPE
ncbi:AvrD family protein [Nocardia arizonensis]|uniref:AvrD family protein n=1 Tax=Nocardia arizonensis TaxID=1141647 RepID=UPI0006D11BCE|nr:AvrD family protein [Nocardia arizonensis]